MTKTREKTREELQAEIEDGKKKIRQFENREKCCVRSYPISASLFTITASVPLVCRIAGRSRRPTLSRKQEKAQHAATPRKIEKTCDQNENLSSR